MRPFNMTFFGRKRGNHRVSALVSQQTETLIPASSVPQRGRLDGGWRGVGGGGGGGGVDNDDDGNDGEDKRIGFDC